MHMLNMRIIGIIMQLAEYEVFMRIVAPTIPLVNTKCALLYDFPLFWRFLRDFLFIAPVFQAHGRGE